MSTVVIVYETNSCDGRVGAKPTGQDINGSLSGCYITHLKHRIFLGKWPFDMIYGVILQTPSCPTRLKCSLGLLLRKVPERNIFSIRLSFGNSFDFWLDWTSCSPKYWTQKIWFLVSEPMSANFEHFLWASFSTDQQKETKTCRKSSPLLLAGVQMSVRTFSAAFFLPTTICLISSQGFSKSISKSCQLILQK